MQKPQEAGAVDSGLISGHIETLASSESGDAVDVDSGAAGGFLPGEVGTPPAIYKMNQNDSLQGISC